MKGDMGDRGVGVSAPRAIWSTERTTNQEVLKVRITKSMVAALRKLRDEQFLVREGYRVVSSEPRWWDYLDYTEGRINAIEWVLMQGEITEDMAKLYRQCALDAKSVAMKNDQSGRSKFHSGRIAGFDQSMAIMRDLYERGRSIVVQRDPGSYPVRVRVLDNSNEACAFTVGDLLEVLVELPRDAAVMAGDPDNEEDPGSCHVFEAQWNPTCVKLLWKE